MTKWCLDPDALRGRIAVVAGATRGAGRGIAAALGEAGATVICSGRSSRSRSLQSDYDRSETIEETAELVTSLGGNGIPVVVDHLDADQVRRLVDQIRDAYGHIDILVNDIWGAEQLKGGPPDWNKPIWQLDLQKGLRILRLAIDTHLITSYHLLPLLIDRPGGLLVEVTDGTSDYNASRYRLSVFYDLAKVAGVLSGPRTRAAPGNGRGDHPRMASVRDDARGLQGHRGRLAHRNCPARVRGIRVASLRGTRGRGACN
jgi:NAD(P)-dependent dehydrogenase (short-subunit alcohol dehydrogenase family)